MTAPEEKYKRKIEKLQQALNTVAEHMTEIQKFHTDISEIIEAVITDLRFLSQDVLNFKKTYIRINELQVAVVSVIREQQV